MCSLNLITYIFLVTSVSVVLVDINMYFDKINFVILIPKSHLDIYFGSWSIGFFGFQIE